MQHLRKSSLIGDLPVDRYKGPISYPPIIRKTSFFAGPKVFYPYATRRGNLTLHRYTHIFILSSIRRGGFHMRDGYVSPRLYPPKLRSPMLGGFRSPLIHAPQTISHKVRPYDRYIDGYGFTIPLLSVLLILQPWSVSPLGQGLAKHSKVFSFLVKAQSSTITLRHLSPYAP